MYARNISSLLTYLIKDGVFSVDLDDELVAGVVITHGGKVIHPALTRTQEPEPAPREPVPGSDSAPPAAD